MSISSLGPIRPPSEAHSLLIRATVGCPWNRCEFCSVFKGQKFELRSVAEVKEDIITARRTADEVMEWAERIGAPIGQVARGNGLLWLTDDGVKSAFLQDSDTVIMKTEPLVEMVEFLVTTFPTLERVCSYARGKTVYHKTPDELARLRHAGLSRLHIGLETGDDELLSYIRKGATAEEMIQAGMKAVAAGFEVSEYVMPGLGGSERWEQHVGNTARVLNEINPDFVRLRTFHIFPGNQMYEKARHGEFHPQTIEGVLLEVRTLVENLKVTSQIVTSDYAWNYFMGDVDGKLPEDKNKLLDALDAALAYWREKGESTRLPFMGSSNVP